MEWKDEYRIREAFRAVMGMQNNHEDRIQAIEGVIAKIEELIVKLVMAFQKGEEDERTDQMDENAE